MLLRKTNLFYIPIYTACFKIYLFYFYTSLITYEPHHVSYAEQMTFVFRSVSAIKSCSEKIAQHFVTFLEWQDITGEKMTKVVIDKLQ